MKNIDVVLDGKSTGLVKWYATQECREPADIINGVVAGELGHVRSEVEDKNGSDDSPEHVRWYVTNAIRRRLGQKEKTCL